MITLGFTDELKPLIENGSTRVTTIGLPLPRLILTIDIPSIIQAFQDLRYIGELRQRWNEIKKLQMNHPIALSV